LLIAPCAVVFGAVLFGETLPPQAFGGMVLLMAGMIVLDGRPLLWLAARFSA
jgi:multidrug transporter EmrE-like cation transporter